MPRLSLTLGNDHSLCGHTHEHVEGVLVQAVRDVWDPHATAELVVEQNTSVTLLEDISLRVIHSIAFREILKYFWLRRRYAKRVNAALASLNLGDSWSTILLPQWGMQIEIGGTVQEGSHSRRIAPEKPHVYLDLEGYTRVVGEALLLRNRDMDPDHDGHYLRFVLEHNDVRQTLVYTVPNLYWGFAGYSAPAVRQYHLQMGADKVGYWLKISGQGLEKPLIAKALKGYEIPKHLERIV